MANLSPTMRQAVVLAAKGGGTLVRWTGGFWTYPSCRPRRQRMSYSEPIPAEYVGTNTVEALIARGVFVRSGDRRVQVAMEPTAENVQPPDQAAAQCGHKGSSHE